MMAGSGVTLLHPLWLFALVPLALLGWRLGTRAGTLGAWQRAARPELLAAMAALGWVEARASRLPLLAALTIAALTVLALSGPAVERRDRLSFRNLDGVFLLLDVSPSMIEDPRWPQLLTMARFAISALGTRPGGLIVFAGDAYVATDLTLDHLQLGQTVSLIGPDIVPDPGSRPERALKLAAQRMHDAEIVAGDVILVTDGGGLGPVSLDAAAALAGEGARVSVIAMHDQSPLMATLADIGGGRIFALEDVDALTGWLKDDARTRLERQDYPMLFWKDLGRVLLLLALVPLLLLFRRQTA